MSIWKLEPQQADSPHWQASTYQGPVTVRAASEQEARHLAAQHFAKGGGRAEDTLLNPWSQEPLVLCMRVQESGYGEEGKDEILEPREGQ